MTEMRSKVYSKEHSALTTLAITPYIRTPLPSPLFGKIGTKPRSY